MAGNAINSLTWQSRRTHKTGRILRKDKPEQPLKETSVMTALAIGDVIPDLEFFRSDGTVTRLSDFAADKLLLIFIRHTT
jgi:hypothetical protein